MSKASGDSGTPDNETTETVADDFGGDGEIADIAALVGAREADDDNASVAPDSELEPGRSNDPSQEPDEDDEANSVETDAPDSKETDVETEPENDSEEVETDETDESEDEPDEPEEPDWVQKRIGKLTARAKGAESELAAAKERIKELEATGDSDSEPTDHRPLPTGHDPVQNHPEVQKVTQLLSQQRNLQTAVKGVLEKMDNEVTDEGVLPLNDGREIRLGREQAEQLLKDSEREARQLETEQVITQRDVRRAHERETAELTSLAYDSYPALKDKGSEESKAVKEVLGQYPWLKSVSSHLLDIGDLLAGRKLRLAQAAEAQKPSPKKKKPALKVRAPGSKGAPDVTAPDPKHRGRRRLLSSQSGSAEDVAAALPDDI